MATAYLAGNYSYPIYDNPRAGVSLCRPWYFSGYVGAAVVVNDTIAIMPLPVGICLEDWYIDIPDLDTGAGLLWQLGDGTTAARFMAANSAGQSAGKVQGRLAAGVVATLPCTILTAAVLTLKCSTGPAVAKADQTVSIRGMVWYHYMDPIHPVPLPSA